MLIFKHQMNNYFKKIHFIARFVQSLCIPLLICTFTSWLTFRIYGVVTIPAICWFKLISTTIFIWYSFNYQQQQLYYYYNLGISKLKLGAGVLLDEPFSHLSPIRVQEMNILIREASKQKGILISDHYYEEILRTSDELYVLQSGKIKFINSNQELATSGYLPLSYSSETEFKSSS